MKKRIITISREFGSGGRALGRRIAEELGMKFYDKEIISKIADETGFSEEFIKKHAEYAPGKTGLAYVFSARSDAGVSLDDLVYRAQQEIIQEIAQKSEPCVIIGRCADYILRDRDDVLNIFVTGKEDDKIKRIMERNGVSESEARAMSRDMDKRRSVHYQFYTEHKWGEAWNYDLVLNTTTLGMDACTRIVESVIGE